jgi:hypothetical protein
MNIESSIRILFQLATRIKWISEIDLVAYMNFDSLNKYQCIDSFYNLPFPISVSAICQDYLVVQSCSYLDEYDNYFTIKNFPNEKERILKLKRIVKPAYKKIKSWKDLKKMRNNIIAHNHRVNGESIYDSVEKVTYIVPSSNEEYTLLADLIFIITQNIEPVFPDIVKSMNFSSTLRDFLVIKSEKINTYEELKRIEDEIEINKNCP